MYIQHVQLIQQLFLVVGRTSTEHNNLDQSTSILSTLDIYIVLFISLHVQSY